MKLGFHGKIACGFALSIGLSIGFAAYDMACAAESGWSNDSTCTMQVLQTFEAANYDVNGVLPVPMKDTCKVIADVAKPGGGNEKHFVIYTPAGDEIADGLEVAPAPTPIKTAKKKVAAKKPAVPAPKMASAAPVMQTPKPPATASAPDEMLKPFSGLGDRK